MKKVEAAGAEKVKGITGWGFIPKQGFTSRIIHHNAPENLEKLSCFSE